MDDGPISMLCLGGGADAVRQGLAVASVLFYPAAALAVLARWRRQIPRDWPLLGLVGLMVAIGIGGGLVRLDPEGPGRWTELIATALFLLMAFYLAMRRFLFMGPLAAGGAVLAFLFFARSAAAQLRFLMGDAAVWAPTVWAALILGGLLVAMRRQGGGRLLALVIGLMTAAVIVRGAGGALCPVWPAGLILWDGLMAGVLALVSLVLLGFAPGSPAAAPRTDVN